MLSTYRPSPRTRRTFRGYRRHVVAGLLALGTVVGGGLTTTPDLTPAQTMRAARVLPACAHEDGSASRLPCVWDGRRQGNGAGASYVVWAAR